MTQKKKFLNYILFVLTSSLISIALALLFATATVVNAFVEAQEREIQSAKSVQITHGELRNLSGDLQYVLKNPTSTPTMSQESIDLAIRAFGIEVPKKVKGPHFDPNLKDRGLTFRTSVLSELQVSIGPDAFSSWGILASTIAHETEVHCKQSFLSIHFLNLMGFPGVTIAEREAYLYEISQASRFGLTKLDQHMIKGTLEYYYPETAVDPRQYKSFDTLIQQLSSLRFGQTL